MCWGDLQLCRNFHRAGVPRIQWKRNQNSFKKRSTECKSHCTENVCCAEQPECPVKAYKVYAEKRPAEMKSEDRMHCFTLAVNNVKSGNNDVLPTDIMQLSGHKYFQSITRYSTVSQKQQLNMKSHSHWNEFGRNSSPVWLFYSGEKKAWVWRTQLSNISSNFFSLASSTAAPFPFFGVLL